MTFEELQTIAIEQETRLFYINCAFTYLPKPNFDETHFKALHRYYINNACWEAMIKLKFPFEHLIPDISFVHCISPNNHKPKIIESISFKFSLLILNQPSTTDQDFKFLFFKFTDFFHNVLIDVFSIPLEIKSFVLEADFKSSHSHFSSLNF